MTNQPMYCVCATRCEPMKISVYDHLLFCCAFFVDPGFERSSYTLSEIVGYRVFSIRH